MLSPHAVETNLNNIMDLSLHPKQTECFLSEATEILYGGAAGGGKSHTLRVIALVHAIMVPNIQVYLFRRLSEDLKKNHLDGSSGFNVMLQEFMQKGICKVNYSTSQIVFKNGSKIHLCHCQYEKDVLKYQGVEINLLLIDELTHFSDYIYKFLRSRVRLGGLSIPKEYQGKLPKIISGSNPGGVGHEFVKTNFIDDFEPMAIYQMPDEEGGMFRQFIPAKLLHNPTMTANDPLYKHKLLGLGGALAKAMLDGDWDAIEGAYFDRFDKVKHVLPNTILPQHWYKVRAFDWGYSAPFCVLWGAISDGSLIDIGGVQRALPIGSIVIYREFYGTTGKPNEGIKMPTAGIAQETVKREKEWNEKINEAVADPACFDVSRGISIAAELDENGAGYDPADNKRIAGWQQIRGRLVGEEGKPMLYIMDNCKNLLRTLPLMQYDKTKSEDLNTSMEDHAVDTLRYLCMTHPVVIKPENFEDVVEEWWKNFNPAGMKKKKGL